jgi:hypothetical protein
MPGPVRRRRIGAEQSRIGGRLRQYPVIGYDQASAIANKANDEGITLREAGPATAASP